jgi:hypothetical protein
VVSSSGSRKGTVSKTIVGIILVIILRTDLGGHYSVFSNTVYKSMDKAEEYILTLDPNNAINQTYIAVKLEKFK